jgi:hypothetical protein
MTPALRLGFVFEFTPGIPFTLNFCHDKFMLIDINPMGKEKNLTNKIQISIFTRKVKI